MDLNDVVHMSQWQYLKLSEHQPIYNTRCGYGSASGCCFPFLDVVGAVHEISIIEQNYGERWK